MDWRALARGFAADHLDVSPEAVVLEARMLGGGLEAHLVCHVDARVPGTTRAQCFVVKQLVGEARREAAIYRALAECSSRDLVPRVLGSEHAPDTATLYLEPIVPVAPWPWQREEHTRAVLSALAEIHALGPSALAAHVHDWDYERELAAQGAELVRALERSAARLRDLGVDLRLSVLRRLLDALPDFRRELLERSPLAPTVIHGDVHTGNVMLRQRGDRLVPVLLDWGRARYGSPLEDVSSWLQSLAFWEPLARRKHDSLLRHYLETRGIAGPPSKALRRAYWLAAASNCIAGSLRYHALIALGDTADARARASALTAVRDQLRILRRAEASCATGA